MADQLASFAQLLSSQRDKNPYKVKAYQRAALRVRALAESLDELVREDADLNVFTGIGDAIALAIREIVLTGSMARLENLRAQVNPELADISAYPRLDPRPILRVFSARLHNRATERVFLEEVALGDPVMPVGNGFSGLFVRFDGG